MQIDKKLATVQMAPHSLRQMVINPQLTPAFRAGESLPRRVPNIYFHVLARYVQFDPLYRPRNRRPLTTACTIRCFPSHALLEGHAR